MDAAVEFLNGNYAPILKSLQEKMMAASEEMQFEKAIEYRDLLNSVKQYDVQTTVESDSLFHILRFFDECLHDVRHTLSCLMAENFRNGRHGSPSKEFQSLFFHDDLKHLFCLVPFQLILWEEEYADAVFPFSA